MTRNEIDSTVDRNSLHREEVPWIYDRLQSGGGIGDAEKENPQSNSVPRPISPQDSPAYRERKSV